MPSRRYQCELCNIRTGRKSDLKRHQRRVHAGKTFKCDVCGFITARKDCLKRHVVLKHGYKPEASSIFSSSNTHKWRRFKCDVCQYSSDRQHNLKRHIEKMHMCPYCNYGSIYKWVVKRHMKAMHPKTKAKTLNNKENTNKDDYIKLMKAMRAQTYVENIIFNYTNVVSQEEEDMENQYTPTNKN